MNMIPTDPRMAALEPAIRIAEKFFSEIIIIPLSLPLRELGELAKDQVRWFRFKKQISILNKAKEKIDKSDVSPGKVSFKILVPLLENGSLEEEESMIDRWANLLANAVNPTYSDKINTGHIEVLRQLSPMEVLVLDRLYDYYNKKLTEGKPHGIEPFPIELDGAQLKAIAGGQKEEFEKAMDNLFRLNLLTTSGALLVNPELGEYFYSESGNISIQFTRFGYSFVSACRSGTK